MNNARQSSQPPNELIVDGVAAEIHSIGWNNAREIYVWLDLSDGRTALWVYVLGSAPGAQMKPRIIEGA